MDPVPPPTFLAGTMPKPGRSSPSDVSKEVLEISEVTTREPSKEGKECLPDLPRMVYIGNLAWSVKWQELKDHMKQAGHVEFCRVLTQDGSDWGRSRGVAYVRYATESEAQHAVSTLNETELMGRRISVDPWTGSKPRSSNPINGDGKGGYFFMKGSGKGGKDGSKGAQVMKGWGKGFGKTIQVHGDPSNMVYVANLPFKAEWQEVKDYMKTVGPVEFVKILTEDGTEYGRSRGVACVRYASASDAGKAIALLNNTFFLSRTISVDRWRAGSSTSTNLRPESAIPRDMPIVTTIAV